MYDPHNHGDVLLLFDPDPKSELWQIGEAARPVEALTDA
jgi:hypothetical protein